MAFEGCDAFPFSVLCPFPDSGGRVEGAGGELFAVGRPGDAADGARVDAVEGCGFRPTRRRQGKQLSRFVGGAGCEERVGGVEGGVPDARCVGCDTGGGLEFNEFNEWS